MCISRSIKKLALLGASISPPVVLEAYNSCNAYTPGRKSHPQPAKSELPVWSGNMDDFFADYRQLGDIDKYINQLQASNSEHLTIREIGRSWENRPLKVLEIKRGSHGVKPCVFIQGGLHPREWISPAASLYVAARLLEDLSSVPAPDWLQEFEFAILPVTNPDGYLYTWEVDRNWRKTRSNRANEKCLSGRRRDIGGVDANRNWDWAWATSAKSSYHKELRDPCSEVFAGPKPFSEPEVAAVANYLKQKQQQSLLNWTRNTQGQISVGPGHVAAFLDYHNWGQMLLPPWAYTEKDAPDYHYQTDLTKAMVKAIKDSSGSHFRAGANLFPPDPGTSPDWVYGELGVKASMTVELEGGDGNPHGFCLPKEVIDSVGTGQVAALKALLLYLSAHGSIPSEFIGLLSHKVQEGTYGQGKTAAGGEVVSPGGGEGTKEVEIKEHNDGPVVESPSPSSSKDETEQTTVSAARSEISGAELVPMLLVFTLLLPKWVDVR